MLFRKKENKPVTLQEVQTLVNSNIKGHDRNRDGTPDYMQRPELISLAKTNKDLNQWESETAIEIEAWVMGLRGYEFDPETSTYKPNSPPTLNEIGIRKIKTHIQTAVNKHGINTSLTDDEVHEICKYHTSSLIKWFKYNRKLAGVAYSDLDCIIMEFDNFLYLVLKRAVNDMQRNHVSARTKLTGGTGENKSSFP